MPNRRDASSSGRLIRRIGIRILILRRISPLEISKNRMIDCLEPNGEALLYERAEASRAGIRLLKAKKPALA